MAVTVNLNLSPIEAKDDFLVKKKASMAADVNVDNISSFRIVKHSIDARQRQIRVNLSVELSFIGEDSPYKINPFQSNNVVNKQEVIIIGAGPAGLFAALRLIELGFRPIVFERGKDVSSRKIDIANINREGVVEADSNYCFGEGGAGTFSDGKLYTRSKKRGDNTRVLELFCCHGANNNIMYEAHPHLGTDKLPGIISNIRKSIIEAGGEVLFNSRVADFILDGPKINGVVLSDGSSHRASAVILATGHSSRDIYGLCARRVIKTEFKPFAVGVRVEHPQEMIDKIMYHGNPRGEYLPPASYNIVKQVEGRGVYSFCMCPGGFIVPSATNSEGVVVNGMSPSKRNSKFANSGIVVEIRQEDLSAFSHHGEFAGLQFQWELENLAWKYAGETQKAPAQRLADFVAGRPSQDIPEVSYLPGVTPSSLHQWLPLGIGDKLRKGFTLFGSSLKGFLTNEAVVIGVESRTSSPMRIPRNVDTMEHVEIKNLYPCGEGSGYSGGIVSSAVDGMRAAESIASRIQKK